MAGSSGRCKCEVTGRVRPNPLTAVNRESSFQPQSWKTELEASLPYLATNSLLTLRPAHPLAVLLSSIFVSVSGRARLTL